MENKEYIWYCPNCNAIILKTNKPFLADVDAKIRCKKCGKNINFQEIFNKNQHNIREYLKKMS